MNTIKIYLAESGRIADLRKDFPLYQGQFQNKLLNVFVPTSILAPSFTSQNQNGVVLSEYVASTSVKIGMTYVSRDGSIKVSKNYYMRYLKTLTYQNVEYALYERKLPKEFTFYAGQGANAPTLIANVVNIEQDTDNGNPKVLSVITTQTCSLDVMPSTNLDNDESVEPSELENINAQINEINEILPTKQDKTDYGLNTTNKTVVGAINENKGKIDVNTANIELNRQGIAQNRAEIEELKTSFVGVEDYIGQMTGSSLPTSSQLSQFVRNNTSPSRDPKNADVVIFILEIPNETDKNYKYIYSQNGWNGYEIPPLETASNGTLGIIQGTYGVANYNTLVDISGGQILNIYVKDETDTYRNIAEYLNTTMGEISDILDGTSVVGEAMKALEDGLGNNIVNTYLTKTLGATKQYVRDYSMPRQFNDVYFINSQGYSKQVPTTPASGIQFTTTSGAVGDFQLFQIQQTNNADFELSSKNGYSNNIYVSASVDCTVSFRLTTQCRKVGQNWITLNVELTSPKQLSADIIEKIMFGNPFAYLGENVISLTDGDVIRQTLEVVTQTSSVITFNVYSNEIYPSIFNLTSQSYVLSGVEQSAVSRLILLGADGVIEANRVIFTIQNAESFVEFRTNQREFLLTAVLPVVGTLDDNLPISIEFGDTVYSLYSFMTGGATPLTIGDLKSVMSYNQNVGYAFYPKLIFIATTDIVGFVLEQNTFTAKQMKEIIKNSATITVDLDETGTKLVFTGSGGGADISIDDESITENSQGEIQAVSLKDKAINVGSQSITSNNFEGVMALSEEQYQQLYTNGTLTIGDVVLTYKNGMVYVTPDTSTTLQTLTLTQGNAVLTSQKTFTSHIQVLIEFETDGMHYGADFILHPYDNAICLVSYNFVGHSGTAYLDENGHINISIPDNLTFSNVKAHYIELGE